VRGHTPAGDCGKLTSNVRFSKTLLGTALALLLLANAGCSGKSKPGVLAPLAAPSWSTHLDVKGFGSATLALPLGATSPRPIVVVLHGAVDRAEWQCGSFRGVLGGRVFILCPQGVRVAASDAYGLGSFDDSVAELRAGLAALKARFGAHVAPSPVVLIGYGEGAAVAADLARQEPAFFARVALVNGNPAAFTSSATKVFAERGGKRVLFFCGNDACDASGVERALLLTREGVSAKSIKGQVGPYLDQRFTDALKVEMPWLVEGDARWAGPRR
jgi:poly(3-hydroxybutyrate) depolymerase